MQPSNKMCLGVVLLLIVCNSLTAQDTARRSFRSYNISESYFIDYLSTLKPNLALIPCRGGIYCPNKQAWYFKTSDTILSAEPSYIDSSLVITLTSRNLFDIEKIFPDSSKKIEPLVITRGYVFYSVPSNYTKGLYFYIVGDSKGFNLCKLQERTIDTLYRSDTLIDQLQVINESTLLFTVRNTIISCSINGPSYTIFNAGNDAIHGFTIDENANLYVSLDLGIIRIGKDKKRSLIVGNAVKGKLRYLNRSLYVLDLDHQKLNIVSHL